MVSRIVEHVATVNHDARLHDDIDCCSMGDLWLA